MKKKKAKDKDSKPEEPATKEIAYIGNRPYTNLNGKKVKRHTVITVATRIYKSLINNKHWMDGEEFRLWIVQFEERRLKRAELAQKDGEKDEKL